MKLIGACIILLVFAGTKQLFAQNTLTGTLTARQIINQMQAQLSCPWSQETVDTFKTGNPDDLVTGVAVCMFANMEALQNAVAKNCNLLIVHEPTFYNHLDKTDMLEDNPVYQAKMAYIKKHKLIIFRFHDHWHRTVPDGIYVGMIEKLGWKTNQVDNSMLFFKFGEQTVGGFAQKLQERLGGSQLRVVGDPLMRFTNVALAVGAPGSKSHINLLTSEFTELLVAGEASEWETYEYVQDAAMLGMKKAAIFTGHIASEEAGMEYCATWLKTFIQDIPITYLENRSSFWTVQKPMNE
ncbi:MAG: Nif3-like dinuclear metal center hexameric protein [Prolixibacteraceae bacterium]|nr:Nif3-like dinuclear metal center hexameric protein [Prolixibacteraceae bacterium]